MGFLVPLSKVGQFRLKHVPSALLHCTAANALLSTCTDIHACPAICEQTVKRLYISQMHLRCSGETEHAPLGSDSDPVQLLGRGTQQYSSWQGPPRGPPPPQGSHAVRPQGPQPPVGPPPGIRPAGRGMSGQGPSGRGRHGQEIGPARGRGRGRGRTSG